MTDTDDISSGVWFVYDGDCPVCTMAAEALRIKQQLGPLHLLDARQNNNHPLIELITHMNLNLDDGMVIYHDKQIHHGQEALHFMAIYGTPSGLFNWFNKVLFKSKLLAQLLYPAMRGGRNLLLRLRGKERIKNLSASQKPIFQDIFGEDWDNLPPVMHAHYGNTPLGDKTYRCEGVMSVKTSPLLRVFYPLLKLLGGIPLLNAEKIPVTVDFVSDGKKPALHFIRRFLIDKSRPYTFHSVMVPRGGKLIVEVMKFRLGWRVNYHWKNNRVVLQHQGYCLCIFDYYLPLPLNWMIGDIKAEEEAIDDQKFKMCTEIIHPFFGKIYDYRGTFTMIDNNA